MKHTNLSFAGVMIGLFLTIASQIRYYILYPDMDKAFFFAIIGILIIAVFWNYAGRIELKKKINKVEQTLTSVEEFIVDKCKEDNNETN